MRTCRKNNHLAVKLAGALLLLFGMLVCWSAAGARTVRAAENFDITLQGTAQKEGTSVAGGYAKDQATAFTFQYQVITETTVRISGYSYAGQEQVDVTLPAHIIEDSVTYDVVGVNGGVFANCPYIKGVTLGSTYEYIGAEAFMGCPITSISLQNVKTLSDRAFYRCKQLTTVLVPASVTSIGTGVFADCSALTAITVETNNAKYSGEGGVLYSKNKDVLIQWPAALTVGSSIGAAYTIGSAACPVRMINDKAFEGCIYLYEIEDMYATVATIGEQAFYGCTNLRSVRIPSTVTTIGKQAFANCYPYLVISCDKTSVAETFANNNGISTAVTCTVRFYDGVSLIKTEQVTAGGSASAPVLNERTGYTLTWDKDYTNVQQNLDVYAAWKQNFTVTFKDAYSGQMAEITSYYGGTATPPVWTRTGYMLGWDSTAYTYVTKDLTINAVWLVSMTGGEITDAAPELGDTRTINYITYQVTRTKASDPRVKAVGCTKQTLTTLTIPATITFGGTTYKVTNIGKGAFRDMPKLTTVTIKKNVLKINKTAFYNCPKLKTITITSKKLTGIGEKAFSKTYAKAKVNVPNSYIKKYKKYLQDAGLSTSAKVY